MIISVLLIALGFVFLIKGADFLVNGSSNVAKKFRIPEIVIGLTIVSIGTSMPELIVSTTSAIGGQSDFAVGNVVGSNVVNLLFILGASAIIRAITIKKETKLIEIPICLLVSIIFMIVCNIGQDINRIEAIILIILFCLFITYTVVMARKAQKADKDVVEEEESNDDKKPTTVLKDILCIVGGIIALKIGGDLTVDNAVIIAEALNVSKKIIGVTILAIGTSLPELVTSVSAAYKGKSDLAIGNIIGSNIFNMLFIIGVAAFIKPITYNVSYNIDLIILIAGTLVLSLFAVIPPKNKMTRMNGIIYVLMYALYMVTVFCK